MTTTPMTPTELRELADRLSPLQYATGISFTYKEFRMVIDTLRAAATPSAQGASLLPDASPGNGAEKVREALQFYADPDNWTDTPSWDGDPDNTTPKAIPILRNEDGHPCDCGDTARKALAAIDKLSPEVKAPASPPDVEAIARIIREHVKIKMIMASARLIGIEDAARAIASAIRTGGQK